MDAALIHTAPRHGAGWPAGDPPDALPEALPEASPALRELARRGVRRRYRKGRLLIEEGDQGQTLFIVCSGRLRAYSAHADSRREITFGTYGPGECVGEMSLDGGPRCASVEALSDCVCSAVARPVLQAFIAEQPAFAFELLAQLIRRARGATHTARQLALNDAYGNLKAWLDEAAVPATEGTRWIAARPTHRALASHIGRSREMVSRLMKDLEAGGYLQAEGAGLRLLRSLPARW